MRRFTSRIATTFSHDLHVSGTPPAFVLSQDQTLHYSSVYPPFETRLTRHGTAGLTAIKSKKSVGHRVHFLDPRRRLRHALLFSFQRPAKALFGAKGNSTARSEPLSTGLVRISGEVSTGWRRKAPPSENSSRHTHTSKALTKNNPSRALPLRVRFPRLYPRTTICRATTLSVGSGIPLRKHCVGATGFADNAGQGKSRCDE